MFVFEKFVKMKDIFVGLTLIVHLDLTAHLDKKLFSHKKSKPCLSKIIAIRHYSISMISVRLSRALDYKKSLIE